MLGRLIAALSAIADKNIVLHASVGLVYQCLCLARQSLISTRKTCVKQKTER